LADAGGAPVDSALPGPRRRIAVLHYAAPRPWGADDRIIYDQAAGRLLFDDDGADGAAGVLFALVDPNLAITAGDFFVLA
jgi:Ca2+-binding RTX toxin-like protein